MSMKEPNKKQNKFYNMIIDRMVNETITHNTVLNFIFLEDAGTPKNKMYNYIYNVHKFLLNKPLSPNMTSTSYKIGEYMKNTYGVTHEEAEFLWDLYRRIIKEKISKPIKSLSPSVIQIIQDDLFERTVKFPNTNKPLCTGGSGDDYNQIGRKLRGDKPGFSVQIYLPSSDFPYNVEITREELWGQLRDYLINTYGMTIEECKEAWYKYKTTICSDPGWPINESIKDKSLNKIINKLVGETKISEKLVYFGNTRIYLHHFPAMLSSSYFIQHCRDVYGLTDAEIDYAWKQFKQIIEYKIKSKTPVNESTRLDKQNEYLDLVVNQLMNETYVKRNTRFDNPELYTPFEHGVFLQNSPTLDYQFFHRPQSYHFTLKPSTYFDYLNEMYGLTSNEIEYVFWHYVKKVQKMMRDHPLYGQAINESTDKQEQYLNTVFDQVMDEIVIDWENGLMYTPFIDPNIYEDEYGQTITAGRERKPFQFSLPINHRSWNNVSIDLENYKRIMIRYLMDIYGLTIKEGKNLWYRIKDDMLELIDSKATYITESMKRHQKQDQFIDSVVKQMINNTEIRPPIPGRLLLIIPDFIKPESPFLYTRYLKSPGLPIPSHKMLKYFINNYGLFKDEVYVAWDRYREIMYKKLKKEFPNSFRGDDENAILFRGKYLNETKDKQKKIIDYIVNRLIDDTIINKISQEIFFPFNIIFYNVVENINSIEHNLNLKYEDLVGKLYLNFSRYMENIYGLTIDEQAQVWEKFGPIITKKIHNIMMKKK